MPAGLATNTIICTLLLSGKKHQHGGGDKNNFASGGSEHILALIFKKIFFGRIVFLALHLVLSGHRQFFKKRREKNVYK